MRPVNNNLDRTKKTICNRFHQDYYVDIHCHCLPAIDDGPATMLDSLRLCEALVDDGISTVIATPHQLGRFSDCNKAEAVREAVALLNNELKGNDIPLTVMAGGDVRVDERICQLLQADKILTLADGGKYLLVELPHDIFINIEPLLIELSFMGIQVIISHPERHPALVKEAEMLLDRHMQLKAGIPFFNSSQKKNKLRTLLDWLKHSAHLQLTAASLLGKFGSNVQKVAWYLLNSGWVSFVATDSHNLNSRRPCMEAAFESISNKLGEKVARLVCIENPSKLLKGQDVPDILFHGHKEMQR